MGVVLQVAGEVGVAGARQSILALSRRLSLFQMARDDREPIVRVSWCAPRAPSRFVRPSDLHPVAAAVAGRTGAGQAVRYRVQIHAHTERHAFNEREHLRSVRFRSAE